MGRPLSKPTTLRVFQKVQSVAKRGGGVFGGHAVEHQANVLRKFFIQTLQQGIDCGRILNVRSRHRDQQNQTEHISHNVAFSAICPLSVIVVDLFPWSAVLTV